MLTIGIDIGGTKILAVAMTDAGRVAASTLVATPADPARIVATAAGAVRALVDEFGGRLSDYRAVGVGVPGLVDRERGEVRNAVNLGVSSLALGPGLHEELGLPVFVDNDVTAAAIGAAHLMAPRSSLAYLNLGTGLAAGIVANGCPWRGFGGVAGEIGHLPVDPRGLECPCGQRGCLETLASGAALRRAWPAGGGHPGRAILAAIAAGDEVAKAAFDRLAEGAAQCVRILALSVDPQSVIIGGGLSRLGEPLLTAVCGVIDGWARGSAFIADLRLADRIQLLPADLPAAAVGAALVAKTRD